MESVNDLKEDHVPDPVITERIQTVCDIYMQLESAYPMKPLDNDLGRFFTFDENMLAHVHDWFYFKEGYSRPLVEHYLDKYAYLRKELGGGIVVDPFSGTGTTVLTASVNGLPARGTEVNPFFAWVANTKLNWYRLEIDLTHRAILEMIGHVDADPVTEEEFPVLTTFHEFFDRGTLEALIRVRRSIHHVVDGLTGDQADKDLVKDFLLLGLVSVISDGCKLMKKGRGLKRRPESYRLPTAEELIQRIQRVWFYNLTSIEKHRPNKKRANVAPGRILEGQSFCTEFPDNKAWISISSPPYCNCFDYSEVYKLELFFTQRVTSYEEWRELRKRTVRSHPAVRFEREYKWALADLPRAVRELVPFLTQAKKSYRTWADFGVVVHGYFDDMAETLVDQARYLKAGAVSVLVVGNSSYLGIPVATDLILAEIAESTGYFTVEEIQPGRLLLTASQQWGWYKDGEKAREYLRESAVVLRRTSKEFESPPVKEK